MGKNIALLTALLVVSACAFRIRNRVVSIQSWKEEYHDQVPSPDPRRVAIRNEKRIQTFYRQLSSDVVQLRRRIPSSLGDRLRAKDTGETKNDASTLFDLGQLLASPIGLKEVGVLNAHLDPAKHPLPRQVVLFHEAIPGWIRLRSRWPQQMGRREASSLVSVSSFTRDLMDQLDPDNTEHRQFVITQSRSNRLHVRHLLDWLHTSKSPVTRSNANHSSGVPYPAFASGPRKNPEDLDEEDYKDAINWIHNHGSFRTLDARSLDLVSRLNHDQLWGLLDRQIRNRRHQPEYLLDLAAIVYWHQNTIDAPVDPSFLATLKKHVNLPLTNMLSPEQEQSDPDSTSVAVNETVLGAIQKWVDLIENGPPTQHAALYRKILSLEPNGDKTHELISQHVLRFRSTNAIASQLATVVRCRWADSGDEAFLHQQAIVENRALTSLNDPNATAEAIRALCRNDANCLADVARFWIKRRRWSSRVQKAWSQGGPAAEMALCESILGLDVNDPDHGLQRTLDAIGQVGAKKSMLVLAHLKRELENANDRGTSRFIDHASDSIRRRLIADGQISKDQP